MAHTLGTNRRALRVWTVVLLGSAACGETVAPRPSIAPLTGRAIAADGGSTSGIHVTLVVLDGGTGVPTTATVSSDGTFVVDVPASGAMGADSLVSVTIDSDPSRRIYRPLLVSGRLDSLRRVLARPLLVPIAVSVPTSALGVDRIPVSLSDAFTLPCTVLANANCDSFYPQRWLSSVALWPTTMLPVGLAFSRVNSAGVISPADSTAFWAGVEQMQRDLGGTYFRPATLAANHVPDDSGYVAGLVTIRVDSTLIGVSGDTEWRWDAASDIVAATVVFPRASAFATRGLIAHELMHALGFSHTCAWSSVMGGYGCAAAPGLTVGDVAAFALAFEVRTATVTDAATTTLGDARRGETQVERALRAPTVRSSRPGGGG